MSLTANFTQVLPVSNTDSGTYYVELQPNTAGKTASLYVNQNINYNPSTGTLNVPNITITGNINGLKTGTTVASDTSSSTTYYPILTTATSGSISTVTTSSTKLTYVPSTGVLSATVMSSTSDERLKENITIINDALNIVNGIDGVRFDWKETKIPSAGLIAQQVGMFMPELINVDEEGNKSLNYNGIIGVLVQAIKEQQKQIDALMEKAK